jgi:hypothetical protein
MIVLPCTLPDLPSKFAQFTVYLHHKDAVLLYILKDKAYEFQLK